MSIWVVSRGSHALSTSADSMTIDVPAGRMLRVIGAKVVGMASSAVAGAELGIFATSANGSGGTPTSLTLKPVDANPDAVSVPTGFSVKHGYSTQPTVEADPKARLSFQPLGGQDRFVPIPGAELEFWKSTAYQVSVRGISGTPNAAIELVLELK